MPSKNTPNIARLGDSANQLAIIRQATADWQQNSNPFTVLSRRMATSLVLEELIAIFTEVLETLVRFDQLTYRHRIGKQDLVFRSGLGGQHRCEYRLSLQGEHYGELTLARRHRFDEVELTAIEQMLAIAICPIRNACQYAVIEQATLTDSLTSAPNKRALDLALSQACSVAERHRENYSLIICDLDHFKQVNDTYGHVIGDHLLKAAAREIELAVRSSDQSYRFGGEEFAVLLPHTEEKDAQVVAERIRRRIAKLTVDCGDDDVTVTVSAGVATRQRNESPEQWLARADEALYRAKSCGRNCTSIASRIARSTG